jgi:hypothetical protein
MADGSPDGEENVRRGAVVLSIDEKAAITARSRRLSRPSRTPR